MESGKIADGQITASSEWDSNHGPDRARLNQPRQGFLRGAWTAGSRYQNRDQWIQISFLSETVITGIITQGRADEDQWVTQYTIEYTPDGFTWTYYGSSSVRVSSSDIYCCIESEYFSF